MKSHALTVHLHQLERRNVRLEGELDPETLDLQAVDPLIRVVTPVRYGIEAQLLDRTVLAQGELELRLECECVRCLKKFVAPLALGDWTALLPLQGEDSVPVTNDSVDLTPFVREDILLAFPRHPLCSPGCPGLPYAEETGAGGKPVEDQANPSAWNELNKLKF